MPYCFVPLCKSRSDKRKSRKSGKQEDTNCAKEEAKKLHFFTPKNDEQLAEWQRLIQRKDRALTKKDYVCSLHFDPDFIEDVFTSVQMPDGSIYKVKQKLVRLKAGVNPTIFKQYPKSCLIKPRKNRKLPSRNKEKVLDETIVENELESRSTESHCESIQNTILEETNNLCSDENVSVTLSSESTGTTELRGENGDVTSFNSPAVEGASDVTSLNPFEEIRNYVQLSFDDPKWEWCVSKALNCIFFLQFDAQFRVTKKVVLKKTLSVEVYFGDIKVEVDSSMTAVTRLDDLSSVLSVVDNMSQCPGSKPPNSWESQHCRGYLGQRSRKCAPCYSRSRRSESSKDIRKNVRLKNIQRKCRNLRKKVTTLQQRVVNLQKHCASTKIENLIDAMKKLNLHQNLKENILACIQMAKVKSSYSLRYTQTWLYECVLLKIKDKRTYCHLRRHKLMALPSVATINRYLRRLKPAYGFQSGTFALLKNKADKLSSMEKEGCLLIDEMSLRETYEFNKESLKVVGFTDLGHHTPENKKDLLGNHGLVIMYQPFQGNWIQPIGSFLSRGAATGTELYLLILEAVILMENSGFNVNAVVTDGATWNRGMWSKFHVTVDQVSCDHIVDERRRLWFVSDFPHLIKNLRNWMTDMCGRIFQTPDGVVRMSHWEEILKAEENRFRLQSVSYKLTEHHLRPKPFQKMNVALAYQLFDEKIADAMEMYRNDGNESEKEALKDCDSSVKFIRRVRHVIKAMSSRTPKGALRLVDSSTERKDIEEFLSYLLAWKAMCPAPNPPPKKRQRKKKIPVTQPKDAQLEEEVKTKPPKKKKEPLKFLTNNTFIGLRVTLQSTVEILQYLVEKRGYHYLMTSRLNQDNLERFFGMIRSAGGNNDHPNSVNFMYSYKLMSAYSLLKPTPGSNVTGSESFATFQQLMQDNCIVGQEEEPLSPYEKWVFMMDNAISTGVIDDETVEQVIPREDKPRFFIDEFFAGYVLRHKSRFIHCNNCITSLTGAFAHPDGLLSKRDTFGVLRIPGCQLIRFVQHLESIIHREVEGIENLKADSFFQISSALEDESCSLPLIGCSEHQDRLTMFITHFYLIMRMNMICKAARKTLVGSERSRDLKKSSKL